MHCRGGKKGGERRRGEFRKKLKIPEYEISQCAEYKIKSKIGKIFVDKKALEEYCVKFYEIEFFLWALWRKIKVDKNGSKYILFRIDVYFSEYNLAVEVDEKRHTDRDLFFFLKKKLDRKFIRINISKENCGADYEIGRTQTIISELKNKKVRELKKENKELKEKIIKIGEKN